MTEAAASGPVKAKARAPRRAPPVLRLAEQQAAIRTLRIQLALKVGAVDDPAERQAETISERVVTMSAPAPIADPAPRAGPPPVAHAAAEDQPDLDSFATEPPVPAGHEDAGVLASGARGEVVSGAPVATSGATPGEGYDDVGAAASGQDLGQAQLARAAAVGPAGGDAPADVAARVGKPGAGRPLPADTRAFMEPRFGVDFSDVRLHDAPAERLAARRIGARAFTLGRRIWLGEGETTADRRLMAHELTHVVQQTRRAPFEAAAGSVGSERATAARHIRAKFHLRVAAHTARIANGNAKRLQNATTTKSPEHGLKAQRAMAGIAGDVTASLRDAATPRRSRSR